MIRRSSIMTLSFIFLVLPFILPINRLVRATVYPSPTTPPFYDGCSSHGGVDCSIINQDASVVCNDGTIIDYFIYAVPQCQDIIQASAKQYSEFLNQSGCFPPSEMTCINSQSYQNLYKKLTSLGLERSELGKSELIQCNQDIKSYEVKNNEYKQCLSDNNNPQFDLPSNRLIQPIMKTVFCPIFYGNNSSYDYPSDLCVCDRGYFMSNGKCKNSSTICQSKYGSGTLAQNGNCLCKSGYKFNANKTACVSQLQPWPTLTPTPSIIKSSPTPTSLVTIQLRPLITPRQSQGMFYDTRPIIEEKTDESTPNFVFKFFDLIATGIKNILKLF